MTANADQRAGEAPTQERHLTATGFVVADGKVLLHWHRKNRLWLPFGGHLEPNEDPVQCVLREVEEETGMPVELYGHAPRLPFEEPQQLPPPVTILVERATDGVRWHQHIDLIYFCRPVLHPLPERFADPTVRWVSAFELEQNLEVSPGDGEAAAAVPLDVRLLALEALRRAAA
jgi:8-oxo-dGTP diphosphatase